MNFVTRYKCSSDSMTMLISRNSPQEMLKVPQLPQDQLLIKLFQAPLQLLIKLFQVPLQLLIKLPQAPLQLVFHLDLKVDVYWTRRGRDVVPAIEMQSGQAGKNVIPA